MEQIRVEYEKLTEIARTFLQCSNKNQEILQRITQISDLLRVGGWIGRGAAAFYEEIDSDLLPALKRLIGTLEEASRATTEIHDLFRKAEEDAASLFTTKSSSELSDHSLPIPIPVPTPPPPTPRPLDKYDVLEKEIQLRIANLKKANLVPDNSKLWDMNNAHGVTEILAHKEVIITLAKRYNIDPVLLAGTLASEKDFDYDIKDYVQDITGRWGVSSNGLGIASVHQKTLKQAIQYLKIHKLASAHDAAIYDQSAQHRVSFEGTAEGAAIVLAMLTHAKKGVHSTQDMAVVWGAYRTGVKDLSPREGDEAPGYTSIPNYINNKANMPDGLPSEFGIGTNAYMSEPYFKFLQKEFKN